MTAVAAPLAGMVAVCVLIAAGLIHIYWAAGGRFGHGAALPQHDGRPVLRPSALATLAVALALFVAAALIAVRCRLIAVPAIEGVAVLAAWALAVIFAARAIGDFRYVGFFKRVTGSRFARLDSALFSPLCLALALLIGLVAAS